MNQVPWQQVCPLYNDFADLLDNAPSLAPLDAIELQPRLKAALSFFVSDACPSKVLIIKDGDNLFHRQLVSDHIKALGHKTVVSKDADPSLLFDRYQMSGDRPSIAQGLVSQADGGFLISSTQTALASLGVWTNLKALLQGAKLNSVSVDTKTGALTPPTFSSNFSFFQTLKVGLRTAFIKF